MLYRKLHGRPPMHRLRSPTLIITCAALLALTHWGRFSLDDEVYFRGTKFHSASRPSASESLLSYGRSRETFQGAAGIYSVAFFLQVSKPTLDHLPRLLARVYHPDNIYAIHFDALVSPAEGLSVLRKANLTNRGDTFPRNIHMIPQEVVNYRGVSMLLNTISAMSFLLEQSQSWRYFINLSASDYPLVTPKLLRELLGHSGPSLNFFSLSPPDHARRMLENRMGEFHIDSALAFKQVKSSVQTVHVRNPIMDNLSFVPSYSEAWMINSREFCVYVTSSSVARKTLLTFAYSVSSPEHYFATLIRNNAVLNATVVPHSMRLILWKHMEKSAGQHPFFLDELHEAGPAQGGGKKFAEYVANAPLFFARKFKRPDSPLMDIVDARAAHPSHEQSVRQHFYGKLNARINEQKMLRLRQAV